MLTLHQEYSIPACSEITCEGCSPGLVIKLYAGKWRRRDCIQFKQDLMVEGNMAGKDLC